ncbi:MULTISPECIES: hypothetical protein [Sphingomonas]|uniref:Uncharacterized protein n=1 Tax=Sphingomonas trueperi TaxID=53317 RepID=A0A7X6BF29_9SPHN|nr:MULTISPECIES: hypothetical protein [Sphingomonas]NJB99407.1 hypothetical protein [Sphingomonas trueperi]
MRRDDRRFAPEASGSSRALGFAMLAMLALSVGGMILLAIAWSPAQ